jgi:hypothetical protein
VKPQHRGVKNDRPILFNLERLRDEFHSKDVHGRQILSDDLTKPTQCTQARKRRVGQEGHVFAQVAVEGRRTCGEREGASPNIIDRERPVHLDGKRNNIVMLLISVP